MKNEIENSIRNKKKKTTRNPNQLTNNKQNCKMRPSLIIKRPYPAVAEAAAAAGAEQTMSRTRLSSYPCSPAPAPSPSPAAAAATPTAP